MHKVLNFALDAGRILLKNGAEIFRVEETIDYICKRYHIKEVDTFVLSNGIFITAEKEGKEMFAKVKHIPLSGTHLGIVKYAAEKKVFPHFCGGNGKRRILLSASGKPF